ncbi:HAD hydrolase family protein [Deinococcus cellulosilyticus]|uniref:Hydrolase n=1 Tax=Deinococcus cellulosilyticus (strain DSM 18568 / NBRC 106333 / KACC 11606 / 5516J-15) TaxID=1223518 RepID=A0A511N298_DEIC1|nr:HAD family hydrolase [Deinococcus cellulosilyticus]GEM46980.1 hydrolase [Deinococcus cellulosilyticus NBRC 106333 = KACC 11606]
MSLFVFDVDGTLIDEATDAHAPELVTHLQALKASGHRIALITGRLGLPRALLNLIEPDARALGNGHRIVLGENQVRTHILTSAEVEAVLALMPDGLEVVGSALTDRPLAFVQDVDAPVWEEWRQAGQLRSLEEMTGHNILQLQFRGKAVPLLKSRIRETLPHLNASGAMEPYLEFLTVTAQQANKGHALKEISALLDIPLEDVVAFGDSENDLEMLRLAGHSVQVGHVSCLKDICKEQVSCPLVGVPQWLGRYLEGRP